LVEGAGAGYNLFETDYLSGTESTVEMEEAFTLNENCVDRLTDQIRRFAGMCQWRGNLYLNGVKLDTDLHKGARRRDLGWATIYTNKTFPHRLVVRIDGMPMFSRYISLDRCVVVEVERSSGDAFTSNRDSLKSEYRIKLDAFIDELTVDKSSALRNIPLTTYQHFEGDKLEVRGVNAKAVHDLILAAYATLPQARQDVEENTSTIEVDRQTDYDDGPSFADKAMRLKGGRCSYDFIIKNNTGMQVPSYFLPYDFSAYSKKLISIWIKCLLELHGLFGHTDTFAVGFILDDDREAEHEVTLQYGRVYYINPIVVATQVNSQSRSLKKRWKFTGAGCYALLAVAVHEFVHGLGYSSHDETYAGRLTEFAGAVLANKGRFHHCFK
jgi:hypothetical protein